MPGGWPPAQGSGRRRIYRARSPVRYLVAIASDRKPLRYSELSSARELRDGDRILVDELSMRVRAVLSPPSDEHDRLLICRPDTTE